MLNLTLKNTRWTGALSIDKNAAATDPKGTVNVKIDEGSSWVLTGDSTVTTLETTAPFEEWSYPDCIKSVKIKIKVQRKSFIGVIILQ